MTEFNIDSWPWKCAIILALLGMREFVRLLSPRDAPVESAETSKWLIETIDSAAIAIGLVLFVIQPFILQAFYIPSGSMEDTLRISDRLLVSKLIYRLRDPAFQDVVVFKAPPAALINTDEKDPDYIKRCMGTPGDVVYVINQVVYRNGVKVPESYVKWTDPAPGCGDGQADDTAPARCSYDMKIYNGQVYSRDYEGPTETDPWVANDEKVSDAEQNAISAAPPGPVPAGYFLMLGDHRSNSNDGHVWGFVPRDDIVGKAICVFWPPTRLGLVDEMSFNPRQP